MTARRWGGRRVTARIRSRANSPARSAAIRSKSVTWAATSARWTIRARTEVRSEQTESVAKPVGAARAGLREKIQQHQPANDWNQQKRQPPGASIRVMQ